MSKKVKKVSKDKIKKLDNVKVNKNLPAKKKSK